VYLYDTNSRSDSSNFFENLKEPEPTFNPQCRGRLHRRIHYISAICGGGKTYVARKAAISRARRDKKSVIVSETINQSMEREKELKDSGVRVEWVDGSNNPKRVTQRIRNLLKSDGGLILLVTHAAIFSLLRDFEGKQQTAVFFDELPGFFKSLTRKIPITHTLLTKLLQFDGSSFDGIYQKVLVLDLEEMKQLAINECEDELLMLLQEMAWGLWSAAWSVYINLEQYQKLKNGEVSHLTFFFKLNPEVFNGWERFSILAADFEDSDFFEHYQEHLDFVVDPLTKKLRATSHTNGNLLTLVPYGEGSASKRSLGAKSDLDGSSNLDRYIKAVEKDVGGRKLLYHAHKSELNLFDADQAERADSNIKGSNKYINHDCIVIASAPNPSPEDYKFLRIVMGLDPNDVHRRLQTGHAYQILCRSPLRNPASTIPVTAYVLTRELADAMAEKFARCHLRMLRVDGSDSVPILGNKTGRTRRFESPLEQKKDWRARQKAAKAEALSEQLNLIARNSCPKSPKKTFLGKNGQESDRFNFHPQQALPERLAPMAFGSKLDKPNSWTASAYFIASSNDDFIAQLEALSKRVIKSKTESSLICPAIFDEDGRKEENIRYCRGVWLDFENGDLTPEEFAKMFPTLWMVIFNSYSHTSQKPRFRVMILTTTRLTTAAYKRIWDRIALKIETAGYSVRLKKGRPAQGKKKSGIDPTSRCPTQLFYLPVQCKYCDGMDSFFWNLKEGREALDAVQWIENDHYIPDAPRIASEPQGEASNQSPDRIGAEKDIDAYLSLPRGEQNPGLWTLLNQLKRHHLPSDEIIQRLTYAANRSHNSKDRLRQVQQFIKERKI
jgi:hypothetical protein